jgi:hypothetical protein
MLSPVIERFMFAMCTTAPCPFCERDSILFLREVLAHHGEKSISDHVQGNTLHCVVYDFHARVNLKLHMQHMEMCGIRCTPEQVPTREISVKNYMLRIRTQRVFFTPDDVLLLLHAMCLTFKQGMPSEYGALVRGIAMGLVSQISPRQAWTLAWQPCFRDVMRLSDSGAATLSTAETLVRAVLDMERQWAHPSVRAAMSDTEQLAFYEDIRVQACAKGTCAIDNNLDKRPW